MKSKIKLAEIILTLIPFIVFTACEKEEIEVNLFDTQGEMWLLLKT